MTAGASRPLKTASDLLFCFFFPSLETGFASAGSEADSFLFFTRGEGESMVISTDDDSEFWVANFVMTSGEG